MNSTLTIVIPTLNRLSLVKRALASAVAQTLPVEIILSDNGSSDGTGAYFNNMALPANVRYFHREATIPVQAHGIFLREQVATDWVVLLSDDDELVPEFAEESLLLISERPIITVVIF